MLKCKFKKLVGLQSRNVYELCEGPGLGELNSEVSSIQHWKFAECESIKLSCEILYALLE